MVDPVLELRKISKIYHLGDQAVHAVDEVTLRINQGEYVALVGASGSGKSTLLHIASLLDGPTHGKVYLKGVETTTYTEEQRAVLRNKEIGFIFQQFNLLAKTSALENVGLPLVYAGISLEERNRRSLEALERVGLGNRTTNSPAQLSGGQQQRVAIARALVNDPSIVFADEPTGNLDSKSGADIMKMLTDLQKEGRTIVMVTHDPELAALADRVITMQDGQLIGDTGK